MTTFMVLFIQF